ncbi:THAP domaincontaining protein 5like, partial [Caligus rogercresseyi]
MSDRLPKSVSTKATKVSLHIFPKDEELKKIWLRSIKRKDFCPSKHSRVCSRHFQESCFVLERQDSNNSRSKNNRLSSMNLAKLKPGAIPTISRRHHLICHHPFQKEQLIVRRLKK